MAINIKEIRNLIVSIYKDLKKDYECIENYSNITYDVGMLVAYCRSIGKKELADKMYNKFMDN
jgi:hypothetical protein